MQNLIIANPLDNITRIEYHGLPVLTTEQLAKALSSPDKPVTAKNLSYNFKYNQDRYIETRHYFKLEGDELEAFKNCSGISGLVGERAKTLYLWTERGCLYHCKSVNTDVAWEAYERLVDTYFKAKKLIEEAPRPSVSNFQLAVAATKLAAHAEDPYEKRKLVVKAANLLFGEEFLPEPPQPIVQLTLFK